MPDDCQETGTICQLHVLDTPVANLKGKIINIFKKAFFFTMKPCLMRDVDILY